MKRLLFQLRSVICGVVLFTSCEQEDVIIDNIQYINSPNCCLSTYNASWDGSTVSLNNGHVTFKTKISGTLFFYAIYNDVKVYQNGKKINDTDLSSEYEAITIKHIPANAIIKIKSTYNTIISNIRMESNIGASTPDSGFDF